MELQCVKVLHCTVLQCTLQTEEGGMEPECVKVLHYTELQSTLQTEEGGIEHRALVCQGTPLQCTVLYNTD